MATTPDSDNGVVSEIEISPKKLRIRGNDIVTILQLLVISVLTYAFYAHDAASAERNTAVVQAVKEQTALQREQLNAQRETNCLARLTPEQKKQPKEIEFCQNLGKGH